MTHRDVVLVGVDGSSPSLHALDWAAAQALRLGWPLHVVCAYSLPSFTAASLDGGYAALDDTAILELTDRAAAGDEYVEPATVVERALALIVQGASP